MARVFTDAGTMVLAGPTESRLTNLGAFSVAFGVYRTAAPAAERAMIVTYNGTAGSGWILNMLATGGIQAYLPFTTQDKVRKSSTVTPLNAWQHVVVTQENRGLADTDWLFFFDGKQEAGTAVAAGIGTHSSTATGVLRIGNNSATALTAPPMNLGPVSIWSRALSPAECLALAGGAHPLRFQAGLVEHYEMQTAHGELGQISNLYLAQGATNPTSAFANPPREPLPSSLYPLRQNYQTRRARYFGLSSGPISFNPTPVIQTWLVAATVLAAAVGLTATPVTQTWNVPGATLSAARTLAPTPVTQTWNVPAAAIATTATLSPTPVVQTWNVPAAALNAARTLAPTPVIQTWNVLGGSVFVAGGPITFNATPAVQTWSVPAAVLSAARTLQPTPVTQSWSIPPSTLSANRTLGATPAIQTWVVLNAGISNPGLAGLSDFTGEASIGPRFTGDAELAPYFSGVIGTSAQFQGVASIETRFSGLLLITPWFDGETEVGPG